MCGQFNYTQFISKYKYIYSRFIYLSVVSRYTYAWMTVASYVRDGMETPFILIFKVWIYFPTRYKKAATRFNLTSMI